MLGPVETVWLMILGISLLIGALLVLLVRYFRGHYASLERIPVTDKEKQEAVELALKGVMFCVLGLLFPPLVLLGLAPLYYGLRKLGLAHMGVGLLEDPRDGSV